MPSVLTADDGSTIEITDVQINGPWSAYGTTRPLGGGLGPYREMPESLAADFYVPVENFCDNFSVLSILLEQGWTVGTQMAFVTALLGSLVKAVGVNGSLIVPSTVNNLLWPVHDAFVNGPISNDAPVQSYVPIGPHDLFLPNQNGPNIRPMTTETALFEDNTVLCIYNDGQINPDDSAYLLNTPFSGPHVQPGTSVIGIAFGQSRPAGLFPSIFLTLSEPLVDAVGPFAWNWAVVDQSAKKPAVFQNGTPFHCASLVNTSNPWDTTLSLADFAPDLASQLSTAFYTTMSHVYIQTSETAIVSGGSYFPNLWTLPADDIVNGPTYLSSLWPSSVASTGITTTTSTLTVRTFVKPMSAGPQIAVISHKEVFEYTGAPQTFSVPPFVKSITIRAFGGGGSSTSHKNVGADGSFAVGTFFKLNGTDVTIYVGQGGGQSSDDPSLIGGLDGGLSGLTGGGGLSGVRTASDWLLVAGGGGQGTYVGPGVPEICLSWPLRAGRSGTIVGGIGETGFDSITGAGGSGYYGGSTGLRGYPGGSGSSLVPKGGSVYGKLEKQKYWSSDIGIGSAQVAGNGRVIIEMMY